MTTDEIMEMIRKFETLYFEFMKYDPKTHKKCALESQEIYDEIKANLTERDNRITELEAELKVMDKALLEACRNLAIHPKMQSDPQYFINKAREEINA